MKQALVVADDLSPLVEVEQVLACRGWEVRRVRGAAAAAEMAREGSAGLLLVQEDGHGGATVVCEAVRRAGLPHPPYVIGVAWSHDHGAIRRLVAAGLDDFLGAPFGDGEIEARIVLAETRIGAPPGPSITGGAGEEADTFEAIQRRLHVQQAFLEGLFENAPEGIVILDREGRIVRINSEFSRVFGYTPAEAIGERLNDLIVPDGLHREGSELDGGVHRGERVMVETVRRHRDGREIDVSVLATPIEVNGPVGVVGIYRDITDKKQWEAALRESEARYRALFDQAPVGVFLCDGDLRITHCNEYLTRVIGSRYEDIVGADLLTLRNSRLLPGLRAALGGQPAFYEGPYLAPTGKYLHVSVQYAPLRDERGQVIGGIGVLDDISDRVTAERQLRSQAAEMERVNRALQERTLELEAAMKARSRLYSAMNHELRTPISAIMLYQELLLAETLGPLTEEQRRALDHSNTAAGHLLDLLRDILDLGKIEAGKVGVQPVEVGIEGLLADLRAAVAPLAERYGSQLSISCPTDAGCIVTDPQRLRQILVNFVSNAAKYGRNRPILVQCRRTEEATVFEVIDEGIGIDETDLAQIFDDFVQVGTGREEGTGLGLAICRRLADLLGVRLEVESKVGVGSTFRVIIPVGGDL